MKNQVIEVLNREHGKKVIEYWESRGVDTKDMDGSNTKEKGIPTRYYGVIDDMFDCYTIEYVYRYNAEIIHLPTESPKEEKTFPRVMLVSYDGNVWYKRVVFMKKCGMFLSWDNAETIENAEWTYRVATWRYAKDIPEKVELTKSEIAEKFGIPFDYIKIVD